MNFGNIFLLLIIFLQSGVIVHAQTRETVVSGSVSLSSQLKEPDTTYEIRDNLDLQGQVISIPSGSSIRFRGGSVKNGKIKIDMATSFIDADAAIFENVELLPGKPLANDVKVRLPEVKAVWFGAVGDNKADDTNSIQAALNSAHNLAVPVRLNRGYYRITSRLHLKEGDALFGDATSPVNSNNQKTLSIIRYYGNEDCIVEVGGRFVHIRDLMILANTPHVTDGISIKGPILYLSLENVMLGNVKYGINGYLDENEGFSQCIFDNVRISNCIRGISVDISGKKGQYVTYNRFYNVSVSNVKEKGIYLHCRALNSTRFMDCSIVNVGYGSYCDANYAKSGIYAIEAINEGKQGSVSVIGGYYENLYYSKDGNLDTSFDYDKNAVFCLENINATIMDARFANSRTIVASKGNDMIKILNCIDNGYLYSQKVKSQICIGNTNTLLDIDGYTFTNKNKDFIKSPIFSKGAISSLAVRNVRYTDNSVQKAIYYNKTGTDGIAIYISDNGDGSGLSEKFPASWAGLDTGFTRAVQNLDVKYTSDVTMATRVGLSGNGSENSRVDINLNGHVHKLVSKNQYDAFFAVSNYSNCSISSGGFSTVSPRSYLLYLSKAAETACRISFKDVGLTSLGNATALVTFTTHTPSSRNTVVNLNGVRNTSGKTVTIANRANEVIVNSFVGCSDVTELIAASTFQSGTWSSRPKTLPSDRAGFIYQATDNGCPVYMWNGSSWLKLNYTRE